MANAVPVSTDFLCDEKPGGPSPTKARLFDRARSLQEQHSELGFADAVGRIASDMGYDVPDGALDEYRQRKRVESVGSA